MKWRMPEWLVMATPVDRFLILFFAAMTLGSVFAPLGSTGKGAHFVVERDGLIVEHGTLFEPSLRPVQGRLSDMLIESGTPGVRVKESNCPHQLCVRQGWAERSGTMIVCVPNKVIVYVVGGTAIPAGNLDAITR